MINLRGRGWDRRSQPDARRERDYRSSRSSGRRQSRRSPSSSRRRYSRSRSREKRRHVTQNGNRPLEIRIRNRSGYERGAGRAIDDLFDESHRQRSVGMDELKAEMEETKRIEREIQDERARLQREEARLMMQQDYHREPPVTLAPSPPRLSQSDIRKLHQRTMTEPSHPQPRESIVAANSDQEVLKPANYLLCTWEILNFSDSTASLGDFHQIGAVLPHGATFIMPVCPKEEVEQLQNHFYRTESGAVVANIPQVSFPVVAKSMKEAMGDFLDFLEKGVRSVRPAYDGVLLLSHLQESIPSLLKAVVKCELGQRFERLVKGVGDLCTYLAQCHIKRLSEGGSSRSGGGKIDLSLETVYQSVFGMSVPGRVSGNAHRADSRAGFTTEILNKLLGQPVTYANFFRSFIQPLNSQRVRRMMTFKTVKERVEGFLPLQLFIARELAEQRIELVMDGFYAPSAADEATTEPQKVALAMCKILVAAGFDFERLLAVAKERGLAELELQLRTAFLGKMAGQSRAAVDQTIRCTRLSVGFFRNHGQVPLEVLMREAEEENATYLQEVKQNEVNKTEFNASFSNFKCTYNYLRVRLRGKSMFPTTSKDELKVMAEMLVNSLVQAKLTETVLESMYKSDKEQNQDRQNFREYLTTILEPHYRVHGPPRIKLPTFVGLLVDFCGSRDGRRVTGKQAVDSAMPEIKRASALLDRAIHNSQMNLAEFENRKLGLAALKLFVARKLKPVVAMSGGDDRHVQALAEHVQKLVAFLGLSFYKLSHLHANSPPSQLSAELRNSLGGREDLLPPGFTEQTFVEDIVDFLNYQEAQRGKAVEIINLS